MIHLVFYYDLFTKKIKLTEFFNFSRNKSKVYKLNWAIWVLRIGIAGTFAGHGTYALFQRADWSLFITYFGFSYTMAMNLMVIVGCIDFLVALFVLFKPVNIVLYWAVFWTFSVALIRPLTGQSGLEFLERFAFIAAPLALLFLLKFRKKYRKY